MRMKWMKQQNSRTANKIFNYTNSFIPKTKLHTFIILYNPSHIVFKLCTQVKTRKPQTYVNPSSQAASAAEITSSKWYRFSSVCDKSHYCRSVGGGLRDTRCTCVCTALCVTSRLLQVCWRRSARYSMYMCLHCTVCDKSFTAGLLEEVCEILDVHAFPLHCDRTCNTHSSRAGSVSFLQVISNV